MYTFGNEEQRQKYLPDMLSGKKIGVFGLTEPGAGSDAGGTRTTAVRDGNEWVINGTKNFITNAGNAEVAIVLAVTDEEKRTKGGMTNFIIEIPSPGFRVSKHENKMGLRGSTTCELLLEDVRVGDDAILGSPGEGFKQFMKTLDGGRISIGAGAVGIAQGAFEEAIKYSAEREQFGKPINSFQAVQFKLADMATQIHAARLLVFDAARRYDTGLEYSKASAMCKLYASEVANRVVDQAVQIHGGYGYIKEFPVERMYRDQKLYEIGEGTSEIQRMVISRYVTRGE
jgi:alkylation response protein AidB-like acyl-CoA dehydrogenase